MEAYSSDFSLKSVSVVKNNANLVHGREKCFRICGRSCSQISMSASEKAKKFFSRMYRFKQMDFEYALWQMVNIFSSPQKLYRNFSYHNATGNQWARDDPAFLILLLPWIVVSSIAISAIIGHTFFQWFKLLMWSVFIDCIASGLVVCTFLWILSNRWMVRKDPSNWLARRSRRFSAASDDSSDDGSQLVPLDVEWAYAFDIHLNAYFPCIVLLRVLQLPFLVLIRRKSLLACLLGNSFWLAAALFYTYITFLGYKALPFLKNTRALLFTGTIFVVFYVITVMLHWNLTAGLYHFYATI
uniref:Protein unc-50 homolog B n=1 Tax=Schistocephalus solidus TaxID=70667 RepID=A0A0X3Q1C8_SCHSO